MKRAQSACSVLVAVALVAAGWVSCSGEEPAAGAGGGGAGAEAGAGARGGSSGEGGAAGVGATTGVTGGATADGAATQACAWEGWNRSPRMPAGCLGLCIPDDLATRLPKIEWLDKNDWCAGCKWLATPWAQPGERAVNPGVRATGPGVRMFILGIPIPKEVGITAWYTGDGQPVAGWRTHGSHPCGGLFGQAMSLDGRVGVDFITGVYDDEHYVVRDTDRASELMTATDTTLLIPAEFKGQSLGGVDTFFSSTKLAMFFLGRTAIGDFASGELLWVDKLPGVPQTGQYSPAGVVGDVVFIWRFLGGRSERWVYAGGSFQLLLGADDRDIRQFATDGVHLVWTEGTQPATENGDVVYAKYDLYKAPFTGDPKKLEPELLLADIPRTFMAPTVDNGFVSGIYLTQLSPQMSAAIVVRLADGLAWRSQLPEGHTWGAYTFPAPDELWGAAVPNVLIGNAESLIRVPYSAMEVLQQPKPGG
jgi:hypothetical protein